MTSRPFAVVLGNGDVVKGLELGLLEMCIGEERVIDVPPALGYGPKGLVKKGVQVVPPNARLLYDVVRCPAPPTTLRSRPCSPCGSSGLLKVECRVRACVSELSPTRCVAMIVWCMRKEVGVSIADT